MIKKIAKKNGLHRFETTQAIYLEFLFSAENGLTTSTFNLKRPHLRDPDEDQINELFAKMPPLSSQL